MIQLLHSATPAPDSDLRNRAASAVQKVLSSKPGGLKGLESELELYRQMPESLRKFKTSHRRFVVVGIGGSSLGLQVLAEVFQIRGFEFLDNVDALQFESLLARLESEGSLAETGWVFISKSGRTVETLASLDFIRQHLHEKSVRLADHSVVVTEKKESDLYNWSETQETLFFEVPLSVGGRFSVLSSVGLVPALLMGIDTAQLRAGALAAYRDEAALTELTAAVLASWARGEWVSVLWSYSSRLKSFGFWWQQLWAESLAKKVDLGGKPAPRVSTPLPLVGATDQHSVLQQVMEGARDKLVLFLRVDAAEGGSCVLGEATLKETALLAGKPLGALLKAEAEAIQQALTEVGVPNLTLKIPALQAENLGHLFMFFQLLVMALGEALAINTFDQPGVELGKVKTKAILGGK